ncbi:MAG: MmcQ/YjbR family DNA-binding protein [Alloprevotella sp.]|nr:MmcQ/YjbR family DNA-binding protein [Alloprevotella sp.]
MNLENVRDIALRLHPAVTEEIFASDWAIWRIGGKWFLLMPLNAPEPRICVKLPPETGRELRMRFEGVRPAYHMNKTHWNDLYLNLLQDDLIREQIETSFDLVASRLPHKLRRELSLDPTIQP